MNCESTESNEFSSCDDLIKNKTLRVFLWIIGIAAVIGNLIVIGKRVQRKQLERDTQSFFLSNLAVADLLMGIYLVIIGSIDLQWEGNYFEHDISWRSGSGCDVTGIISMLSSVVSIIMLAIITWDRLSCIVFPFKVKKITLLKAIIICSFVWVFGIVVSVIPVMGLSYFYNDQFDFGFYGRSSVCLPMQLSPERYAGWEYAAVFFVALPGIAFTFMLFAYIAIFIQVKRSEGKIRKTTLNRESSLAKKAIFIVITDFLCWMPVVVIGTLALTGAFYDPTKQVYVWIAIFVLPINSSINPFLYTFSTFNSPKPNDKKKNRKNVGGK